LPLLAPVPPVEAAYSIAPGESAQRLRVALVEDNDDARAVMADLLELLGHEVVTAADGPAALRLAQERAAAAFVVDIGLPGMDGYEVARRLRRQSGGEQLLLIAL